MKQLLQAWYSSDQKGIFWYFLTHLKVFLGSNSQKKENTSMKFAK